MKTGFDTIIPIVRDIELDVNDTFSGNERARCRLQHLAKWMETASGYTKLAIADRDATIAKQAERLEGLEAELLRDEDEMKDLDDRLASQAGHIEALRKALGESETTVDFLIDQDKRRKAELDEAKETSRGLALGINSHAEALRSQRERNQRQAVQIQDLEADLRRQKAHKAELGKWVDELEQKTQDQAAEIDRLNAERPAVTKGISCIPNWLLSL